MRYTRVRQMYHSTRFASDDLGGWFHRSETFFERNGTPWDRKVTEAVVHLEGHALQWHHVYVRKRMTRETPRWEEYVKALRSRFGVTTFVDSRAERVTWRQTSEREECLETLDSLAGWKRSSHASKIPLRFGSITPGFVNDMLVPARTSSAFPNWDEQSHEQVTPVAPKQQLPKNKGVDDETMERYDYNVFKEVKDQLSGQNHQIQSQGSTITTIQYPKSLTIPPGGQQQMFVHGFPSHALPPHAMIFGDMVWNFQELTMKFSHNIRKHALQVFSHNLLDLAEGNGDAGDMRMNGKVTIGDWSALMVKLKAFSRIISDDETWVLLVETKSDISSEIEFEDFLRIYLNFLVRATSDNGNLKNSSFLKSTTTNLLHTISESEKASYVAHINSYLRDNPFLEQFHPLDLTTKDMCNLSKDGVLQCQLINVVVPGTIDERAINTKCVLNLWERNENHIVCLNSAKANGCTVVLKKKNNRPSWLQSYQQRTLLMQDYSKPTSLYHDHFFMDALLKGWCYGIFCNYFYTMDIILEDKDKLWWGELIR